METEAQIRSRDTLEGLQLVAVYEADGSLLYCGEDLDVAWSFYRGSLHRDLVKFGAIEEWDGPPFRADGRWKRRDA